MNDNFVELLVLTSVLMTYILSVSTFLILPGPVNIFVANATLKSGMKGTFWAIFGTNLASLVLIMIAGILIASAGSISATLLDILTLFGGVFLLYYGIVQIRDVLKERAETHSKLDGGRFIQDDFLGDKTDVNITEESHPHSHPHSFSAFKLASQAFAIGISNPKDVIFFIAFFPPFILQMQLSIPISLLILTIIWCILDYTLLFLYGMLTQKYIKGQFAQIFSLLCGALFLGIGVYAIYLAVNALLSL